MRPYSVLYGMGAGGKAANDDPQAEARPGCEGVGGCGCAVAAHVAAHTEVVLRVAVAPVRGVPGASAADSSRGSVLASLQRRQPRLEEDEGEAHTLAHRGRKQPHQPLTPGVKALFRQKGTIGRDFRLRSYRSEPLDFHSLAMSLARFALRTVARAPVVARSMSAFRE